MSRLYRTTNGGLNWNFQFESVFPIGAIFFLNGQKGWMRDAPDLTGNMQAIQQMEDSIGQAPQEM
jgi:hypothetical protein